MRSAESARFQSEHRAKINAFIDDISQRIEEAIDNGKFSCAYCIPTDTKQEVRDEIEKILGQNGYTTDIPLKEDYSGWPADQMPYWDTMKVSW
jgi:hypothetical protein